MVSAMIRQIAPQFFTTEMAASLGRANAEYVARGVEFTRALGDRPWHSHEFVVKDCDGRLLAFGEPGLATSSALQSEAYDVGADSESDELLSAHGESHRRGLDGGVQRNAP